MQILGNMEKQSVYEWNPLMREPNDQTKQRIADMILHIK